MVGKGKRVRRKEKFPRRPTGYKFFLRECIQELRGRCPEGSIVLPMLSQLCAQVWMTLNPRLKVRFQQEADYFAHHGVKRNSAEDGKMESITGACFAAAAAAVVASSSKVPITATIPFPKEKKKKKDPVPMAVAPPVLKKSVKGLKMSLVAKGGPKRPLSSFVYFCKEERSKVMVVHPELKMGQVSQVLSRMWAELDSEQKLKYQNVSRIDRERYSVELAAFKKTMEVTPPAPSTKKKTYKRKQKLDTSKIIDIVGLVGRAEASSRDQAQQKGTMIVTENEMEFSETATPPPPPLPVNLELVKMECEDEDNNDFNHASLEPEGPTVPDRNADMMVKNMMHGFFGADPRFHYNY